MRLRELLDRGMTVEGGAAADPDILALTADSRAVVPGSLFAALAGSRADGRRFVADAIRQGAVAVLADPSLAGRALGVPLILDPEPRRRLALMAARFHRRQPAHAVAVTGTSGKTSVVHLVRQIWAGLGYQAGSLGTLGLQSPALTIDGGLTTPDPVRLHAMLARLAQAGVDHVAFEASSHGLDQHRLDGVAFEAAAFTNLSRDHFDYHGTEAAYFAAKARLFAEQLPASGCAVLNADIAEFERLRAICSARAIEIIDYGERAQRLRLVRQNSRLDGQSLVVAWEGAEHRLDLELIGNFQAGNVLAAVGLVLAGGYDDVSDVMAATRRVQGVPGRLQLAGRHPGGAPVFVDYAHKPDALEKVLRTLRPHVEGRLSLVFGCGGDRDPGKRAAMGRIARLGADRVFITDDNPRSEDPASIRRSVLEACPGAAEIGDRREAIHLAVSKLGVGDVLVVAGKGHETGQIVGASVLPFDDVAIVRAALAEMPGSGPDGPDPLTGGTER